MPTLFTLFGFRFMFYSNKASELRLAESVIEENKEIIINRWNEYFKK